MRNEGRAELGVPRLLALLATAVEEAAREGRNGGRASWGRDIAPRHDRDTIDSSSGLRIRSLRRVYNILLFGGPSHNEIVAQAAWEDSGRGAASGCGVTAVAAGAGDDGSSHDAISAISASISVVSLELRSSRRYDPANALEGLVDELIEPSVHVVRQHGAGATAVARALRLLTALRGEGGQARGADDWELVGGHGRRVLERLYSGNASSSGGQLQQPQQRDQAATTASLPVAMFFRDGRGCSNNAVLRSSCQLPVATSFPPPEASQAKLPDAVNVQQRQQRRQQQYLLPEDCVLHGDSTATATATPERVGTTERIPWFTDAEFASERGLPNTSKRSSLDVCLLEAMSTAPLSPAAWTRLHNNAAASGDSTQAPSFWAGSGGSPAARTVAFGGSGGSGGGLAEARGQHAGGGTPLVRGGLDLCGALSQARVDAQSPVVRELRLALSFPDLAEDRPTDLLEAARLHQRERPKDRPASGRHSSSCANVEGVCSPGFSLGGTHGVAGPPTSAGHESVPLLPRPSNGKLSSGCSRPSDTPAPAWDVFFPGEHPEGEVHGFPPLKLNPARRLEPVGWERTEADWNDPSFPEWALACAPLVTAEGGGPGSNRAFESCYREHFEGVGSGGFLGEAPPAATTAEAEVARRALAVLQGVPSDSFWFDESHARMRVFRHGDDDDLTSPGGGLPLPPPRVAGLSPAALSSLLKEFAVAGTWYRRVEEFASCLVDRSSSSGQVAHAFGVELRRQLAAIHSALLVVTTEFAELGWNSPDARCCRAGDAPPGRRGCSLAGALVRTARLRQALGALAEVCGLFEEDLGVPGGARAVSRELPRGAALLSHLYSTAEMRVASRPEKGEGGETEGVFGAVMGEKDSALALLSSAASPYLAMLGRWLWSGEMRAEDDPWEEFPVRCRERLSGGTCPATRGRGGGLKAPREAWVEDGGGSFMTLAFSENKAAGVPCFLEGGVLAAAARAGKLLRMLKLSSPEFYAACSASPPPPLSPVFGARALASRMAVFQRLGLLRAAAGRSAAREVRARVAEKEVRKGMASGVGSEQLLAGEKSALGKLELQRERDDASVTEARRIWVQGLERDRAAADDAAASAATAIASANATAAATAAAANADDDAEKPSSAAASGGGSGGVLSFLDPPTSEAEAFAAAVITERYRLLGQETDARAARARWKRQRSSRAVAARASLKMLYAEESHLWKGLAAEKAAIAAAGHGTPGNEGVVGSSAKNVPEAIEATPAASSNGGSESGDGAQNGRVAAETLAESEDEAAAGDGDGDGGGAEVEAAEEGEAAAEEEAPVVPDPPDKHKHPEDAEFSPVAIVDKPGGNSVSVSAALGDTAGDTPRVKFSHVSIVQDPGGASRGVSGALGAGADSSVSGGGGGDASTSGALPGRSGLRRIVEEPGGSSSGVSRILSHDVRDASRVGRASAVGTGVVDGVGVDLLPKASTRGPGDNSVSLSLRAEEEEVAVAAAGGTAGRHGGGPTTLQDEPALGASPDQTGIAEGEETSDGGATPRDRKAPGKQRSDGSLLPGSKENEGARGPPAKDTHTSLPLEVMLRRCVREPVLAQCSAVDSAALAFLVRDAGVAEHLASLRTFLLGLTSDFLHDFTLRLLDGLYDGGVDWRRPSNLDAAYAASSSATGLDSVPLAETFRYEIDPTCGGVLGAKSARGVRGAEGPSHRTGAPVSVFSREEGEEEEEEELYSPVALSFVSPVLEVKWPVGLLLPTGVLHTYGGIHRSLFRHQLTLHRLRRLRAALRELGACMDASSEGGGRVRSRAAGQRRRGGGAGGGGSGGRQGAGVAWDRGRLHWLHLFRHEMQHMADSLQTFFAEQAEAGWPDLHRSLAVAGHGGGGGLAALVAAHSRYISRMHHCMFLGADRHGARARARIGEFYEVVCTVGRITDGLLLSKPSSPRSSASSRRRRRQQQQQQQQQSGGTGEMLLPDGAFAELAAAREKFDAARQGFCGALSEICAGGGGARARPLLATVGYGGYGGQDVF